MDTLGLSPAKAVLLAVQLVSSADLPTLRTLIAQHRSTFRTELVLRILLSHLPESVESSDYVPFLEDLVSASIAEDPEHAVDGSALNDMDDAEARKQVRKLNLLALRWPSAPEDVPDDPLILFLMHRSLLVDAKTGMIDQLPELLAPFLHHSTYLRTWMISTILPLLRFNYQYHPEEVALLTIPKFEALDDRAGANLLLSRTGKNEDNITVGRDLRGLVGPWMYGDTLLKRRKIRRSSSQDILAITLDGAPSSSDHKYAGWEEVFRWMHNQAANSWKTAVAAVEQWDGPGDVDLGSYADGTEWLDEDDQLHLERRYARSILATAYTIPDASEEVLNGVQRMLTRIVNLLDKERIPTLQAAAAILIPVPAFESISLTRLAAQHFRSGLQNDDNILTAPMDDSIQLLYALLISAFLCTRLHCPISIRTAGLLICLEDENEQRNYFTSLMKHGANGPKEDDKYWIRLRNELLWLRGWGEEESSGGPGSGIGRGIFGRLPKEFIETELLKALLANTRYDLAKAIYETSMEKPLRKEALAATVLAAAMSAYDNATNPNRTRGGLKKASDILRAFPATLEGHVAAEQIEHLVGVTDKVGHFRLVFKQGEPFKPATLRTQDDPIGSIISKILDQNPKSYTSIDNLVDLGKGMVNAGLTKSDMPAEAQQAVAEKRVVAMCIDAALTENDFETAYSYVVTRLRTIGGPSHARSPDIERLNSGLVAEAPPKALDDWSWRAALQAGKYRRNKQTIKPTHLGNASANPEIRHLEQRMECLAQALKLAPKATLHEILNAFRRCEEELESHLQAELEQSEAWDAQGDENSVMPGGFAAPTPQKASRAAEEAPMTLFDLSRATFGSAISTIKKNAPVGTYSSPLVSPGSPVGDVVDPLGTVPVRKRDQLRNVAVGGLASGVGWLIGAPPTKVRDRE